MPKESIKDKLSGNELDLSHSNLTQVPLCDLIELPKATHLDLSCNMLKILPCEFIALQHVIEIDLCKNQLKELPSNFGELKRLQYLDLMGNQLTSLPISFGSLRNLKYLDLKENPLSPPLKNIAGDCANERQCGVCAKNVLELMKKVQGLQKKIQHEQACEEKMREEEEQQKLRDEKRRKKQLRCLDYQQSVTRKLLNKESSEKTSDVTEMFLCRMLKCPKRLSCRGICITFAIGLIAVALGLYIYCLSHENEPPCNMIKSFTELIGF